MKYRPTKRVLRSVTVVGKIGEKVGLTVLRLE